MKPSNAWIFQVATECLTRSSSLSIVYYENFKANPKQGLLEILKFLKFPVDPERFDCVMNHVKGPVNRGQIDVRKRNNLMVYLKEFLIDLLKKIFWLHGIWKRKSIFKLSTQ